MKGLKLSCRVTPSDKLQASAIDAKTRTDGPLVVLTGSSVTGARWDIVLDKDTARELFNWLGVFLHAA